MFKLKTKKIIIEDNKKYTVIHCIGETIHDGCQCFKKCFCRENFRSSPVNFYIVRRKNKNKTSSDHWDYESLMERLYYLNSIEVNDIEDNRIIGAKNYKKKINK